MQIHFVLVEPQVPENVGAAARALKTMGFERLRLVNSRILQEPRTQWVAHGSREILQQAEVFASLEEALADIDLAIGTSAKARHNTRYLYSPDELKPLLLNKGASAERIALVFGREDRGLSGEELALCDLLTSIPMAVTYPSLNLGQAVMLYAWELSQVPAQAKAAPRAALDGQLRALRPRVARLMAALDVPAESKLHRWADERLGVLAEKDIHFLHSLCSDLERALDKE